MLLTPAIFKNVCDTSIARSLSFTSFGVLLSRIAF